MSRFNPTPIFQTSQRLYQVSLLGLIVGCVWLYLHSPLKDPLLIGTGLAIVVLGAWPMLEWARRLRPWFPVFEISMLTTISFYALPLLEGHPEVLAFPEAVTWQAATGVLVFQAAALAGFNVNRWRPVARSWLTEPLLADRLLRHAQAGLWVNTLYLVLANFTDWLGGGFEGTYRAIFFGIGIVSLFIQFRRWGAGDLPNGEKIIVAANLTAQIILLFSGLYLVQGMSFFILAMIGYVTASRRVPIVVIAVAVAITAVLHNGKSAMRALYWEQEQPAPTLTELPAFFTQWFRFGLTSTEREEHKNRSLTANLVERASLFQMLCLVVNRVPDHEPYLSGGSYVDIPALLVPRFLWPDKPSSLQANARLALYFGLVDMDSATKVSIAFGPLAESYVNFGLVGLGLLGAVLGVGYKFVCTLSTDASQLSGIGLFVILLTAWSFQSEMVAATWVSSLFQASVVAVGIPLGLRTLFASK
ncbi:MAG: hypothetical protein WBM14_02210 [Terracidiphilus sp.]